MTDQPYEMGFEICLIVTNVCQLNCNFCGRNELSNKAKQELHKDYMSVDTVKKILDNVDMSVVDSVSLTPVIGDLFLHKDAFEILDVLESDDRVDEITLTTNLLALSYLEIDKLLTYKKVHIVISMYGWDNESYTQFTGRDMFNTFLSNLRHLYTFFVRTNSSLGIVFGLRQHPSDLYRNPSIKVIMQSLLTYDNVGMGELEVDHHNFCGETTKDGTIPEATVRKGTCWYLMEGPAIYPNGDICYCPTDIHKKTKIGNVLTETWEEITGKDSIYELIKQQQARGIYSGMCIGCSTWKHPDYRPMPWGN